MEISSPFDSYLSRLPSEILWTYRNRYLPDPTTYDTPRAVIDALVRCFGDKAWVKQQLRKLSRHHHLALIAMVQAGGVAGGGWIHQELALAHGGNESFWQGILGDLGYHLLVFGNNRNSPPAFYNVPSAILEVLVGVFSKKLSLPGESHPEVRLSRNTNFSHPVGFSLVSFLTYLEVHSIRVTQKDEIFKKQLQEMNEFFANLWGSAMQEKVREWHLTLLRDMGLVRSFRGHLEVDRKLVAQWLAMEPRQRRDLYLALFAARESLVEWLLTALSAVDPDHWVPLEPLQLMYRRWYMGSVFHKRFIRKTYFMPPSGLYNPNPPLEYLQLAGLVERGLADSGSYIRLSTAGRAFLEGETLGEEPSSGPEVKFHIQPNFEIYAPAGLPLRVVYRLGQLAELVSADRVNRYLLSAESVERALDLGWRGDEFIRFLREHASYGIPGNVESQLADWIGNSGEVEFHDALILKVRTERLADVQKLLKDRKIEHRRLARTIFAIPREEQEAALKGLRRRGMQPNPQVYRHDYADDAARARGSLHDRIDQHEEHTEAWLDHEGDTMEFPVRQLVVLHNPVHERDDAPLPADGRGISFRSAAAGGPRDLGWTELSGARLVTFLRKVIRKGQDLEIVVPDPGGEDEVHLLSPARLKDDEGEGMLLEGYDHNRSRSATWPVKRIARLRTMS